jgi:hypothetical protein
MKFLQLIFLFSLGITSGCNFRADGKSNEDREKECEEICAKITSMPSLPFDFMYYDSAEVDSVIIKEISPGKKDTAVYYIKADYELDNGASGVKRWHSSWQLRKEIPLENEYLIIVKGEAPHLIKDFKMGPEPLCNMFDCDYEPGLVKWSVDGQINNYDGITIWKK